MISAFNVKQYLETICGAGRAKLVGEAFFEDREGVFLSLPETFSPELFHLDTSWKPDPSFVADVKAFVVDISRINFFPLQKEIASYDGQMSETGYSFSILDVASFQALIMSKDEVLEEFATRPLPKGCNTVVITCGQMVVNGQGKKFVLAIVWNKEKEYLSPFVLSPERVWSGNSHFAFFET